MMVEPTLKKALEPYLEGLDKDINYDPSGNGISALFLAMMYSTKQGSFSPREEDRKYAKKVVELLLAYGADPTRHEGNNPEYATPLSAAKVLADSGRDPENIYELLLEHSINSAVESAAFEDESTDKSKNKVLEGVSKAIRGLGNLGKKALEKRISDIGNAVSNKVNDVLSRRDQKTLDEVRSGIKDSYKVSNQNGTKPSDKNLSDKYFKLPDSAKKRFIYENLPKLSSTNSTDSKLKSKIAEDLVKIPDPYKSGLYISIKNLTDLIGKPTTGLKLWNILLNPKYQKIHEALKTTTGLSKNEPTLVGQLAYIAYYLSNSKPISELKDGSNWKSLSKMKASYGEKPDKNELTGREIVIRALGKKDNKLSKEDAIKFVSNVLFKGDMKKSNQFVSDNLEQIGKTLNKKFGKNFDDDNLLDKLKEDLSSMAGDGKMDKNVKTDDKEVSKTGREIIISLIGGKGDELSRKDGLKYMAEKLFNGDLKKAEKFFDDNRKAVTQVLNRKYEKTFKDDDLQSLMVSDLDEINKNSKQTTKGKTSQLTDEQKQASLALQSLGYTKSDSNSMVKDKEGDSSQIVYQALRSVGK